jgi:malate synthase
VLNGKGASLLNGYMEDLATDRIYRLMIAQRMRHAAQIEVVDEKGAPVRHSAELITQLFDEELDRLLHESAAANDPQVAEKLRQARRMSEAMIRQEEFNPA